MFNPRLIQALTLLCPLSHHSFDSEYWATSCYCSRHPICQFASTLPHFVGVPRCSPSLKRTRNKMSHLPCLIILPDRDTLCTMGYVLRPAAVFPGYQYNEIHCGTQMPAVANGRYAFPSPLLTLSSNSHTKPDEPSSGANTTPHEYFSTHSRPPNHTPHRTHIHGVTNHLPLPKSLASVRHIPCHKHPELAAERCHYVACSIKLRRDTKKDVLCLGHHTSPSKSPWPYQSPHTPIHGDTL